MRTQIIQVNMTDEQPQGYMFAIEELDNDECLLQTRGYAFLSSDANLWAAAPDLLEACKAADGAIIAMQIDGVDRLDFIQKTLQQAIEKAESR